MQNHLIFIGILLIALAAIHIIFPKYFEWNNELKSLSLINRQMMRVHTFFVAFTVLLMGLLCLTSAKEIIETNIGQRISLGFGIFWAARLFIQFFGYSSKLWKGKTFETAIHIIFSILWTYLSVVFFMVWWN
jgi:hypothetical protein